MPTPIIVVLVLVVVVVLENGLSTPIASDGNPGSRSGSFCTQRSAHAQYRRRRERLRQRWPTPPRS